MRLKHLLLYTCALVILAGCASKDPLDYLPDSTAYLALNGDQIRTQAGAKKLSEIMHKLDPKAVSVDAKMRRAYIGFSGGRNVYGVVTGQDGLADSIVAQTKANGGIETKVNGRKAIQAKQVTLVPLGKDSVLFCSSPQDFDVMEKTAKKKNPAAVNSAMYKKADQLAMSHAIAFVMNPTPIIAMGGGQLGALSIMNPKGVEALKQVSQLTITGDWNEQPKIAGTMHLPSEEQGKELAGLLNMLLGQVRSSPAAQAMSGVLNQLKVQNVTDGVEVGIEYPKEEADKFLAQIETSADQLPEDPQQREQAIRQMFQKAAASRQ